jgi:hypothetical protein
LTSLGVKRCVAFLVVDVTVFVDESSIDECVILVGVLGIELPLIIGLIVDLNDVERVNIRLFPVEFDETIRRLGGGDGGGNDTPGRSALP